MPKTIEEQRAIWRAWATKYRSNPLNRAKLSRKKKEDYQKNKEFLVEGNMVILMGQTSKKEDGGIIVNKVCQI